MTASPKPIMMDKLKEEMKMQWQLDQINIIVKGIPSGIPDDMGPHGEGLVMLESVFQQEWS